MVRESILLDESETQGFAINHVGSRDYMLTHAFVTQIVTSLRRLYGKHLLSEPVHKAAASHGSHIPHGAAYWTAICHCLAPLDH